MGNLSWGFGLVMWFPWFLSFIFKSIQQVFTCLTKVADENCLGMHLFHQKLLYSFPKRLLSTVSSLSRLQDTSTVPFRNLLARVLRNTFLWSAHLSSRLSLRAAVRRPSSQQQIAGKHCLLGWVSWELTNNTIQNTDWVRLQSAPLLLPFLTAEKN